MTSVLIVDLLAVVLILVGVLLVLAGTGLLSACRCLLRARAAAPAPETAPLTRTRPERRERATPAPAPDVPEPGAYLALEGFLAQVSRSREAREALALSAEDGLELLRAWDRAGLRKLQASIAPREAAPRASHAGGKAS